MDHPIGRFGHVRYGGLAVAVLAAMLLAATAPLAAAAVNAGTVVVLAWLLLRGGRRHDALRRSRLLLLGALGTAFCSSVMAGIYDAVAGHAPPMPWAGDVVALTYIPLTLAGLILVAPGSIRTGHRARAFADGFVAASALWYLLVNVGLTGSYVSHTSLAARITQIAYPVGDLFVVSTALAVLARSGRATRGFVGWIAAGLSLVAANDLWQLLGHRSSTAPANAALFEGALLLLIAAGAAPPVCDVHARGETPRAALLLDAAPFLPLLVDVVVTGRLVFVGRPIEAHAVLPAVAVSIALMLRQIAGSRDKQRLVDELQEQQDELQAALRIDDLTGLTNRLGMTESLDAALEDSASWPLTVALIDVDDFKLINDNHGHAIGDQVLSLLGRRLADAVRAEDTVARLGGDEFAVVAAATGPADRDALVGRLLDVFNRPVTVNGQSFVVHASIGVVEGKPPDTPGQLLAHADAAMYDAKADRGSASKATVLDVHGRSKVSRQLRIREEIAAPDLRQFSVHYQPVVDLATGRIRGIEALLRWQHPFLGSISPDLFVPMAEQAGSIDVLGQFVLETALVDLVLLDHKAPGSRLVVGVNVSPRQLARPDFAQSVLSRLAVHGLEPSRLALEITEHAFESRLDAVTASVARLADAGVDIAVDDFGTGYASLRYLQRLSLTIMKIDRSFVQDIATCQTSQKLVGSLTTMAAGLGLQAVAEGIETLDQLRLLQEMNVELGQGFLFAAAAPIDAVAEIVGRRHSYRVGAGDAAPLLPVPRGSRADTTAPMRRR